MRHLLVPACLGLLALPATIGLRSALLPDSFSDITAIAKISVANASTPDGGVTIRDKSQSRPDSIDSELPLDADAVNVERADLGPPPPHAASFSPAAMPVVARTSDEICNVLASAARSNGVPVSFFIHLLFQESRFRPDAVSAAGAQGIAQFMPQTAASVGLDDPFDPLQAIPAAARLLRNLTQQFGNLGLAAAAYNAGPKRIQDWLANKGELPEETQGYVKSVTGRAPDMWAVADAGSPKLKLPRHAPCQEEAGLLAWNAPEQIPLPPAAPPKAALEIASHAGATIAERARAKISKRVTKAAVAKHSHAHKNVKVAQN